MKLLFVRTKVEHLLPILTLLTYFFMNLKRKGKAWSPSQIHIFFVAFKNKYTISWHKQMWFKSVIDSGEAFSSPKLQFGIGPTERESAVSRMSTTEALKGQTPPKPKPKVTTGHWLKDTAGGGVGERGGADTRREGGKGEKRK